MELSNWAQFGLSKVALNRLGILNFSKPSETQAQCLSPLLEGKPLFVVAPTGSGKTLAYLLPLYESSLIKPGKSLILVPTRELAYQVSKMAQALWGIHEKKKNTVYPSIHLHIGGRREKNTPSNKSATSLHIGTPGRVLDICQTSPNIFSGCSPVILDEYDKLLKLGFKEQLQELKKFLPKTVLIQGFSATAPRDINRESFFKDIPVLTPAPNAESLNRKEYICYLKSAKSKFRICRDFLKEKGGQTIIFVGNVEKANHLQGSLKLNGYHCRVFHRKLTQKNRDKVYQMFMDKKFPILVATDLASRGLDTLSVDKIINYDFPATAEDYTHRVGRSGRLFAPAVTYTFADPDDFIAHRNLKRGLSYPVEPHPDFPHRDKWLESARRKHLQEVRRNEKTLSIKKAQGLID